MERLRRTLSEGKKRKRRKEQKENVRRRKRNGGFGQKKRVGKEWEKGQTNRGREGKRKRKDGRDTK